jgi:excisionase family DNA binding protein
VSTSAATFGVVVVERDLARSLSRHVHVGQVHATLFERAMRTLFIDPETQAVQLADLHSELQARLRRGENVAVTIGGQHEVLSPAQVGRRLGFSRQHVARLIEAGDLRGERLEGSRYWKVPLSEVIAFEERRDQARAKADAFSRSLEELGAPAE